MYLFVAYNKWFVQGLRDITVILLCHAKRDRTVSKMNCSLCVCFFTHVDIAMTINVGFMAPAESVHVPGFHRNEAVSGLKPEKKKQNKTGSS